ncbi:MAG: hypothetical protein OD814_001690, partial [Candidatus Alkanophagales archaeon MCA70_species_1]|nr:hypothetical protein [Candidatus Alkanophaga volatiphilum]
MVVLPQKVGVVVGMTEIRQVYKCEVCGNIIEVLHAGKG